MNELLLFLLVIAGIFLVACSIALIALGRMIDRCPTEYEETRERGIASPVESTKLASLVLWAMFIPGAWLLLQEGRNAMIIGITTIFAVCLFMLTALVFSFAVLSTMRRKKKVPGEVVLSAAPPASAAPARETRYDQPALGKKSYKPPVSNFLVDALIKKD
jgi:bacteriorhodopsin